MTAQLLRLLYGAIVISSGFLIGSMARLSWREYLRIGSRAALRSVYFWLAFNLAVQAGALVVICGIRTLDAFNGVTGGANWGWLIVVGFGLLFVSKVGFTWAGTLGLQHGKAIWRGYLACLICWGAFVGIWAFRS